MACVTLAVAALELAPKGASRRWQVVASLAAVGADGTPHTVGTANIWVGTKREALLRITTEGLGLLKKPAEVTIVCGPPDLSEPEPSEDAKAAFKAAASRHQVRYKVVPEGTPHEALERAQGFAKARSAGLDGSPTAPLPPIPPRPGRLFG